MLQPLLDAAILVMSDAASTPASLAPGALSDASLVAPGTPSTVADGLCGTGGPKPPFEMSLFGGMHCFSHALLWGVACWSAGMKVPRAT